MRNMLLLMFTVVIAFVGPADGQWVRQTSGIGGNISDVVMLDSATVIAVARTGSILRTTDTGKTWVDVSLPLSYRGYWNAISFCDSGDGALAGDDGKVFWTFNAGKGWLWSQIPNLAGCNCVGNCLSVLCTGAGSCYVGTDSGYVYSTSDTGRTWQFEKISRWPVVSIYKWRGEEPLVGVSKYALTSHSVCTQYVIPPPSWSESILFAFEGLGSQGCDAEYCKGGDREFIVGVQGDLRSAPAVLRKSLRDTSWQSVSSGITRSGPLLGVSAPSPKVIYVCGSDGMIYRSADSGDTWIDESINTTRRINAIYFIDDNRGFAVGDSGSIYYTSSGGVTAVDGRGGSRPYEFSLGQNYPNPFNPTTTIGFVVRSSGSEIRPDRGGLVVLKVYDVLGRLVKTLVDSRLAPGEHSVVFDGRGLPSGVYFYRLAAGGLVQVRKMLLVK